MISQAQLHRGGASAVLDEDHSADELIPLSYAQQRLWFLDQLEPNSPLYNVPSALRIQGELNLSALKLSLQQIVERHEILRTVYVLANETPAQKILENFVLDVPLVNLASLTEACRQDDLSRRLAQEAGRPFDLSEDLMVRAAVYRLAPRDHVLFLNIHHIACDEWSMTVLHKELASFYRAACRGGLSPLSELPVQYADFAIWQRDGLEGPGFKKQLDYWRSQLSGTLPAIELPADKQAPRVANYRGARVKKVFPEQLARRIRELCVAEGVTGFTLLLAAFKALLHRYTAQEDIVLGTPIAGRNRVEVEGLIGFFVNTLVLRSSISGSEPFVEFLRRTRMTTLDAFSAQDVPFERLVEELQPDRNAQNPLFNVMFAVQNTSHEVTIEDLTITPLEVENGTAKFDLTLVIQDAGQQMTALLEYNCDLFEAETADRVLGHLERLLEGVVSNPHEQIAKLPMLAQSERSLLLDQWNQTTTDYPKNTPIHRLFEIQAEKTPEAIAVIYGEARVTYRDIDERANQLANQLRQLGVRPNVLVGICVERSVEMVVGWLGILKAGGAYVPLDPGYPPERLQFMLEDTNMPVLLTQKKLASRLPKDARKLCLDSDWKTIARQSKEAPAPDVRSDHLAYVIYTSGSTGKPKGVAVPHQAIARLVFNTNYIQLSTSDRIAQASNSSFDAATFEVWGALLHGATLIGVSQNVLLAPRDLATHLRSNRITTLFLTTALFNQIAAEVPDAFHTLKHVLFGGEACDPKSVKEILTHGRPQRLLHVYGPTETTTFASWYEVKSVGEGVTTLPIGQPLSNTTFYVLDKYGQIAPVGVPGELYIGGDGVATGYLNRPELTAAKFVANPFSESKSDRLYKTGDLVRWLPDGNIEFIGRIDHQVKIRGFRIELEEIEIVLEQHVLVKDAVVSVYEDSGGKRIAAYVVPRRDGLKPDELRVFIKSKLPDFMVPAAFVFLDNLPLTPNGKVDRRALPAPEVKQFSAHRPFLPARNNLENQLVKIWENVLGCRPVGVRDNFFELGGHSLLAVRLFAQIEKSMGQKIPLSTLFQAPTIEQLAGVIRRTAWSAPGASLVEIQPRGSRPPIFWLHTLGGGGGGGLFTYRKLAELLGPDQPSYGLVAPAEPFTQIEAMAAHYIEELRTIQPVGPYYLGGYCFGGVIAYEMARQLMEQGARVEMLALVESVPPNVTPGKLELISHFFRVAPAWCAFMLELGLAECAKRFSRKIVNVVRKVCFWNKGNRAASIQDQISEVIDFSHYPDDYKRYAEIHWSALAQFRPRQFNGTITLFRTPRPRLSALDAERTWQKLSTQPVNVRIVPGTHENVLEDPQVRFLAKEIKDCLGRDTTSTPSLQPKAKAA
jgi:amino acid adenylation domain-containing protein